jgi:hypothetical protein
MRRSLIRPGEMREVYSEAESAGEPERQDEARP